MQIYADLIHSWTAWSDCELSSGPMVKPFWQSWTEKARTMQSSPRSRRVTEESGWRFSEVGAIPNHPKNWHILKVEAHGFEGRPFYETPWEWMVLSKLYRPRRATCHFMGAYSSFFWTGNRPKNRWFQLRAAYKLLDITGHFLEFKEIMRILHVSNTKTAEAKTRKNWLEQLSRITKSELKISIYIGIWCFPDGWGYPQPSSIL